MALFPKAVEYIMHPFLVFVWFPWKQLWQVRLLCIYHRQLPLLLLFPWCRNKRTVQRTGMWRRISVPIGDECLTRLTMSTHHLRAHAQRCSISTSPLSALPPRAGDCLSWLRPHGVSAQGDFVCRAAESELAREGSVNTGTITQLIWMLKKDQWKQRALNLLWNK